MLDLNKKAVSPMIGYILLIVIAVVIGAVVYQWTTTYIPTDEIECPDGVGIFIETATCVQTGPDEYELDFTMKNNGRFDIDGYFIHATTSEGQELATKNLDPEEGMIVVGGKFKVGEKHSNVSGIGMEIFSIEITPIRFQIEENKERLAVCGDSKAKEKVSCAGFECMTDAECGSLKCIENSCELGLRIFVTSDKFLGDIGKTEGLDEIDAICQEDVNNPDLSKTWKAIVGSEYMRGVGYAWIMKNNMKYYRTDQSTLITTTNPDGWFTWPLENSIGDGGQVWTGLDGEGQPCQEHCDSFDCVGWTSENTNHRGNRGRSEMTTSGAVYNLVQACSTNGHLYCVEQVGEPGDGGDDDDDGDGDDGKITCGNGLPCPDGLECNEGVCEPQVA